MNLTREEKVFQADELSRQRTKGALFVSKEQYDARVEVCKGCDQWVDLMPVPELTVKGCKVCKCPTSTKPHFRKYFSLLKMRVIKTICPHESGDKWKAIDKLFES